ncbi:TPA: fimbrial biogenesis outer membrane usher protein [Aeromonas sobria]|nr:fimbrial biogenesis outer membrane usher protein [Aeromonas sobria]
MKHASSLFSYRRTSVCTAHAMFCLFLYVFTSHDLVAKDYFDPSLLSLMGQDEIDLDLFTRVGAVPEGEYLVDIYLNGGYITSQSVLFLNNEDGVSIAQLTPAQLKSYGVDLSGVDVVNDDTSIGELSALIPYAKSLFSLPQLRLDLVVPQIYIRKVVSGYIDPSMLDNGVMAAMFNYSVNVSKNRQAVSDNISGTESLNVYTNLNGGLNVGPWRIRSSINFIQSQMSGSQYSNTMKSAQLSGTHLYRSIPELSAVLDMGQINTGGEVLDSVPLIGAKLTLDDSMQPWLQRGFSPVISGVAQSNALVTITQNGNVIHQSNVSPGPFQIDDLYQAGSAGDLVVTLAESDGSKRIWTEAYSSLPMMLQQNSSRYEIAVGYYDNNAAQDVEQPAVAMGSFAIGLPHAITLYSGALLSQKYQSLAFGSGVSLGLFGALSADITGAKASLPRGRSDVLGASYRVKYSKSMLSTGSSVDLTSYRYATSDYYSFNDVNNVNALSDDNIPWSKGRKRSSLQVNLSQSLGRFGSMSLRGSLDDYWDVSDVQKSLSTTFNSRYDAISYNIAYSLDRRVVDNAMPINRQISFNISVPISIFAANDVTQGKYLSYSINHGNDGRASQYINGSGSTDDLSYSVSAGMGNLGQTTTGSVGLGYNTDWANLSGGYNIDQYSQGINVSLSGGTLIHEGGITFAQYLGDTIGLVRVADVEGVASSSSTTMTDSAGHALVPYMSAYNKNVISLDPTTLPGDVDVSRNSVNVYPTRGAVVLADFKPRRGYQAFVTLPYKNGVVPFGATVELESDKESRSIVGEGGEVYLTGLPQKGILNVKWGSAPDKQCHAKIVLPSDTVESNQQDDILQISARCQ